MDNWQLKRISITILFILMFLINSNAQFLYDEVCVSGGKLELDYRKKPWKGDNQFLIKFLEEIKYFDNQDKTRFLIPVKFWVYHDNDGMGGSTINDIKEFIIDLNNNNKRNQTGIQFYISDIKNINSTNRQVMGYYLEATLQTFFRYTKSALNVHLIEGFKKKQESRKVIKGSFNIGTNSIVLQRKNSSTGLTHEVGHYFQLLHPHRHYNNGKSKQEPVSRTRTKNENAKGVPLCEERGDLLADTKAEPKLTYLVDNDCNFTGTALKDEWGDNYQSDINNIMSYPTHYRCRDSFTISQKAVMLYAASTIKYAKFWNTQDIQNHKYQYDNNEPDDYMEIAGNIETGAGQSFNFHKIFMGKNKDRNDTCDWIKFEIKKEDKRNVKILVKAKSGNENPISAKLFDKNHYLLSKVKTAKADETIELGFKGVVSDWYYIQVTGTETVSKHVDSYSVEVELYE